MAPTTELDYKKYLQLIWKKRYLFVIMTLIVMTGAVITSYLLPERYEAKCTVFIEKSVISDLVKGIAVTPSMDDKIRVLAYAMKSRSLLLKVLTDLDLNIGKQSNAQQEQMIKKFQGGTDIKVKDREGLFIISFFDENPRLARDYVNTLVRRYIEENSASKREDSYDAIRFLSEQIAPVKQRFEQAEAQVNEYKRKNGTILAQNEGVLQSIISDAQQRIDEIAIRRNELENQRIGAIKNDPLKARLAELHKRLNELNLVYTDSYPEVIEVKSLIKSVREQMKNGSAEDRGVDQNQYELGKITMDLKTLTQTERNLRRTIAEKREQMKEIPATRASLDELQREMYTQKNLYEQLLNRHGQSEVSKQVEVQDKASSFRIVDPAITPSKPVSPDKVKIILLGMIAGLAASFALIVLLDYLDNSVRNLDTLKSLGLPILAIVPKIENIADINAVRKRDLYFFTAAATYFSIILVTLSIEFLREQSIYELNPVQLKLTLAQLKNIVMK